MENAWLVCWRRLGRSAPGVVKPERRGERAGELCSLPLLTLLVGEIDSWRPWSRVIVQEDWRGRGASKGA